MFVGVVLRGHPSDILPTLGIKQGVATEETTPAVNAPCG